ncbi:hypothetical protein [Variovorax sp. UMC13]|uniref:hypothetical protein n=1 Tax=Variovorax sp. UMC13 TaxID=1862326 RepID=UPI0016024F8D|nr:hypothetical protein [Variovorax sp. UMC13]
MKNDTLFMVIWVLLCVGSFLAAVAVNDYSNEEIQRVEAVYTKGMAEGSALCGGRP